MFKDYLFSIKDDKYKEFHKSLVLNSQYEIIGIRLPEMRKIAKEISKTNIESYLNVAENFYYEEVMIQGLVISYIKDENVFEKYFTEHVKKIDNWALCDTFCNSIKLVRKYEEKYFKIALDMSLSEDEFISRTGLVIILSHFISEKNIKLILETLNKIKSEKFYINMAEAWLICELYIKFKEPTLEFIKNNNLNKFTHNKAISKIHDSYRVSVEEKEYLNSLRRK
jgi:3-methyladenine DNA glycosylase AlkD